MMNMLKLYAVYNCDMNIVMIDLLSGFPSAELDQERIIFCRSIRNLLAHLVRAGWFYSEKSDTPEDTFFLHGSGHPSLTFYRGLNMLISL